jgi:hypothetical protein
MKVAKPSKDSDLANTANDDETDSTTTTNTKSKQRNRKKKKSNNNEHSKFSSDDDSSASGSCCSSRNSSVDKNQNRNEINNNSILTHSSDYSLEGSNFNEISTNSIGNGSHHVIGSCKNKLSKKRRSKHQRDVENLGFFQKIIANSTNFIYNCFFSNNSDSSKYKKSDQDHENNVVPCAWSLIKDKIKNSTNNFNSFFATLSALFISLISITAIYAIFINVNGIFY